MTNPTPTEKRCGDCKIVKPASEFHKRSKAKGTLKSTCKACVKAYAAEWRAENAERLREQSAAWYAANRKEVTAKRRARWADDHEFRAARHAAGRAWYQANIEHARAIRRAWREANPERSTEYILAWQRANPEKVRAAQREYARRNPLRSQLRNWEKRSIRAAEAAGDIDLDALWTGACAPCGDTLDREIAWPHPMSKSIDHIIPLALGGGSTQDNLQWAHLFCNQSKGARSA